MTPIVTASQMRAVEAAEFTRGTTEDELSDRAAVALERRVRALTPPEGRVLVLAGPGNNGLDAVKVHRLLTTAGVASTLATWRREGEPPVDPDVFREQLAGAHVVLDGLFGIGLERDVEGEAAALVGAVNEERARRERGVTGTYARAEGDGAGDGGVGADPRIRPPADGHGDPSIQIVALDLPSGLHADTGRALGVAVTADLTVTLGMPKLGLFTGSGPALAGEIVREPIGLRVADATEPAAWGFDREQPLGLPPRRVGSHKNDNGRVLVLGGSLRYPGAPVLAALAAHRAGGGYVTVAFPRSLYGVIGARLLEQTLRPLPEADFGALGPDAVEEAREAASDYAALVLGSGLGREDSTVAFVLELLGLPAAAPARRMGFAAAPAETSARPRARRAVGFVGDRERAPTDDTPPLPPVVLDGDGLYALSTRERWWEDAEQVALLTPHPGEMARLLSRDVPEIEADRIGVAREAAALWGVTVLLKGSYPVVASPDGAVSLLIESHPELGTAGTGDVLAGLCGLALALGLSAPAAARAALVSGARAAAAATEQVGRDLVGAGDLVRALPSARREGRGLGRE